MTTTNSAATREWRIGDVVEAPPEVQQTRQNGGFNRRWFVIQSNPRCEERAVSGLREKGFKVFLPKEQVTVMRHRVNVDVSRPLFPRYLFVGMSPIDFYAPRRCDGVSDFLRRSEGPEEIAFDVVNRLILADLQGAFDYRTKALHEFRAGDQVRFHAGPFSGFLATIAAVDPEKRIECFMSIFGRASRIKARAEDFE